MQCSVPTCKLIAVTDTLMDGHKFRSGITEVKGTEFISALQ